MRRRVVAMVLVVVGFWGNAARGDTPPEAARQGNAVPLLADPRNVLTGHVIPDEGYCDQPYVVITREGHWLCVLTTGPGREGDKGQHVVATLSTDRGRSWSKPVDIEPSGPCEASWVVPLIVPSGRIYAFYTYNGDRISHLRGKPIRADTVGWFAYRYSDDNGKTWSERYRLPLRITACDRSNDWQGKVQMFWGIDKPNIAGSTVYFAFTKLGRYMLEQGEGWVFRSDNLLTERDPARLRWQLLPEGEYGIRAPEFGSIQEEHNLVPLHDGSLYCVYRTTLGHPCHAYSRDGGRTWTKPQPMTYTPGDQKIKNPRACPMVWRTSAGKYLFWFHNNGHTSFDGWSRNPVWITGGVEKDGFIHWAQPEILLYHPDPKQGMSYPDLIEQEGHFWVTETQKTVARVHMIDGTLLEGLWNQGQSHSVSRQGLVLDLGPERLRLGQAALPRPLDLRQTGGLAIDLWLQIDRTGQAETLLDARTSAAKGFALSMTQQGTIQIELNDGTTKARWDCDPGALLPGKLHHVVVNVDAGAGIISFVVDGRLCDGGAARPFGWHRYRGILGDVSGAGTLRVAPAWQGRLKRLRLYARFLRTSEAVAHFHAGTG